MYYLQDQERRQRKGDKFLQPTRISALVIHMNTLNHTLLSNPHLTYQVTAQCVHFTCTTERQWEHSTVENMWEHMHTQNILSPPFSFPCPLQ